MSRADQRDALPSTYLLLERYITEVDPYPRYSVEELRTLVREEYAGLLDDPHFATIFEPAPRQCVLIGRLLLLRVIHRAYGMLGDAGDSVLTELKTWIDAIPDGISTPVPFIGAVDPPANDAAEFQIIRSVSDEMYAHLEDRVGVAADRFYEKAFQDVAEHFGHLDAFLDIVSLLPEAIMDGQKMRLLSQRRQVETERRHAAAAQSELHAARQQMLKTSVQLKAVLNTVGEGILTVDEEGVIRLINREAEAIWGSGPGELLGKNIDILTVDGYSITDLLKLDEDAAKVGTSDSRRVEVAGVRENGAEFPLELRISETQMGDDLLYTAAARDITERRGYEEALIDAKERAEEMARTKTAILANMSHEIRTPLTGIMGFASVLSEVIDTEHIEFAQLIRKSGQRLLDTLNSILDLAYLESGEYELEYKRLDVVDEVRALIPVFEPAAEEKGLSLTLEVDVPSIPAITDAGGLHRIFNNLIGNALKFTERGGITVGVWEEESRFFLLVRDTGIGISEHFLPSLFTEFKQESSGLRRQFEGSGLGLTITKRIVDRLNGEITVKSSQGKGTEFIVGLPKAPPMYSRRESSRMRLTYDS